MVERGKLVEDKPLKTAKSKERCCIQPFIHFAPAIVSLLTDLKCKTGFFEVLTLSKQHFVLRTV